MNPEGLPLPGGTRRDGNNGTDPPVITAPLPGASPSAREALTHNRLKLAIFSSVYAGLPLAEAARRVRHHGFSGVILEYAFADLCLNPLRPDWTVVETIQAAFRREEVAIAGLYGYYNVVDPDSARRLWGEARMSFLLTNWERLGSPVVATETGTFNAQSEWLESPENATESAYARCRAALERLVAQAEKHGAILAIEPNWRNIIGSVDRAARLFRDLPSPALKLIMDPSNYYRKEDLPRMDAVLEDLFRQVGKHTVLAHAKDVAAAGDETHLVAAGRGVLNYPLYLHLLAGLDRECFLALERLSLDDVPRARDYVLRVLGVRF